MPILGLVVMYWGLSIWLGWPTPLEALEAILNKLAELDSEMR